MNADCFEAFSHVATGDSLSLPGRLPESQSDNEKAHPDFCKAFKDLTKKPPFGWQIALFSEFAKGTIPPCCDLPTGLGKTSVLAIWLLARAAGAALPRRLVYVVDRRAVVDQATTEALKLKESVDLNPEFLKALGSSSLPVSTLRGQFFDNRDWLRDPTVPAVIVGTVDMVGSRLLFEGYGVSRKMRPFQAGLLGCDTLVVLDEAHLVPPFEALLKTIETPNGDLLPRAEECRRLVPSFKILSLSATSRNSGNSFGLTPGDLRPGTLTFKRLMARKRLTFRPLGEGAKLPEALARWAWELCAEGKKANKIIVFSDSREVAQKAYDELTALAKGDRKSGIPETRVNCELLVGARRGRERGGVADWLEKHGFLGDFVPTPERPSFVFATSAGEVGVDMSADHLVCDLVTWERMIQRLGRVNRRGEGDARVIVVTEPPPKPTKAVKVALEKTATERDDREVEMVVIYGEKLARARALAAPFDLLPQDPDGIDVSPNALRDLRLSTLPAPEGELGLDASERQRRREVLAAATFPEPLRPALTRALVDAWSMTSLREHTGRPRIQPWLRGWIKDEEPQTTVLWRTFLPVEFGQQPSSRVMKTQVEAFFEAAPPHLSEKLETETHRVVAWLLKRAEVLVAADRSRAERDSVLADRACAVILEHDGEVRCLERDGELRRVVLCARDLSPSSNGSKAMKRQEERLCTLLAEATLVLDAKVAGLSPAGLLDLSVNEPPPTLDGTNGTPDWLMSPRSLRPAIPFRVRQLGVNKEDHSTRHDPKWLPRFHFPRERSAEGEPQSWLVVEKWGGETETADDATAPDAQGLDAHQSLVAEKAARFAKRLGLPREYADMLVVAARLHDEGKRHDRWQNAFKAPLAQRPCAKTKGPIDQALLDGYRHEFASLAAATRDEAFLALPPDLQDLALHLIAAHHGFARPVISTRGDPETPPSALQTRAREVASRFSRLQAQWGPWGLAWWESLLRAADHQASSGSDPAVSNA